MHRLIGTIEPINMEKRILVTGVGRRIELMQAFREAASKLNITLKLIGADMAGTAPALAYCDYYRNVCAMKDPAYIDELLTICREEKIDLLMPTIDTDLLVLSQNVDRFEQIGTRVMISAPDKIAICRDKNYTSDFFVECGLKAPKPCNDYMQYDGPFPCFIKPKDGSSSINAFKVNSAEELPDYAARVEDYIIQPFIDGTEYTVDIFCDFEGNPIYVTPRIRLAVRSGEVLKTEIKDDAQIIEESMKLIKRYKPCGPITVQLIRQKETGDDYYIEINPRYGGGAPLSMKAGARSAEAVLRLLCGEKLEYIHEIEDGAIYSRFDQCVCIKRGENPQRVRGVIFDLDDTLYPERQYVRSGYNEIATWLWNIFTNESELMAKAGFENADAISEKLWNLFLNNEPAIDKLVTLIFDNIYGACSEEFLIAGMNYDKLRQKALSVYRSQMPDISLYDGVKELICDLRAKGIRVGIITDGRPEGQGNKIDALQLNDIVDDIIITDSLGGSQFRKPCDISYRIMQNRWKLSYEQMVYVGDNPTKDFIAPIQLGMQSVYVNNPEGIYYKGNNPVNVPMIDSVVELMSAINI